MPNLDRIYRPRTLDEFRGNPHVVDDVRAIFKTGDMPHLMFIGPPGCGKTTLALLIASHFLKSNIRIDTRYGNENFTVLNASSERGIDVVREIIAERAKAKPVGVPFIFIFLDEVDSTTVEFQHALRNIMEVFEDRCKFILCLNHIEGIKEPALISRCNTFFLKRPSLNDGAELFLDIASKEGVEFEDDQIALDVAAYYKGDLRHMLNDCLEVLRGYDEVITRDHLWKVYEMAGKSVAERVSESDTPRETFFDIYKTEAFNVRQFLENYYDLLGNHSLAMAFAKIDARLRMYASEVIQVNYLFSLIENTKGKKNEIRIKPKKPF